MEAGITNRINRLLGIAKYADSMREELKSCKSAEEVVAIEKDDYISLMNKVLDEQLESCKNSAKFQVDYLNGDKKVQVNKMSFLTAARLVDNDFPIRRKSWENDNQFVIYKALWATETPDPHASVIADDSLLKPGFGYLARVFRFLICDARTGSTKIWHPSLDDILANDWEIMTKGPQPYH